MRDFLLAMAFGLVLAVGFEALDRPEVPASSPPPPAACVEQSVTSSYLQGVFGSSATAPAARAEPGTGCDDDETYDSNYTGSSR